MEEQLTPQDVICSKCGSVLSEGLESKSIDEIIKYYNGKCPNCGKPLGFPEAMSEEVTPDTMRKLEPTYKKPSRIWYLLPIFFTWIGGIIGYFLMKNKDKKFAKRLLIVGLILTIIFIVIGVIIFLLGINAFLSGIIVT